MAIQTGAVRGAGATAIAAAIVVLAVILAVIVVVRLSGTPTLPILYPEGVPHAWLQGDLTAFVGAFFG